MPATAVTCRLGRLVLAGRYALRDDGTVWAWGDNFERSLGNEFDPVALAPVQVQGVAGVTAIGGGLAVGYAVS